MSEIVPTTPDGRNAVTGRFLPGCKGGPGNQLAYKQRKNRLAILNSITPQVAQEIALELLEIIRNKDEKTGDRIKAADLITRITGAQTHTEKLDVNVKAEVSPSNVPVNLSATDIAALELIRTKLTSASQIIDQTAEVIEVP